ncbi:MAG: TlpA family protein disulfide reductase [Actinomycetota bacterium]
MVAVLAIGGVSVLLATQRQPGPGTAREPAGAVGDRGCGTGLGLLSVGERVPDRCTVEAFRGGRLFAIGEFRGTKPMVLNFWASWCVFCIKEMPDFQRVYEQAGDRVVFLGLDLLGVQAETRGAAERLAVKTGVRYPLAYDEGGKLYARLSPRLLMPTTVFVRSDGVVAFRQFGPLDAAELRTMIRKHLGVDVKG